MKRPPPALASLLAGALLLGASASALELKLTDDISAQVDSTISFGIGVRVEDRDHDLVGRANGGDLHSINYDNGNLNYKQGDIFSAPLKITQEIRSEVAGVRLFGRWFAFYDLEVMEGDTRRTPLGKSAENHLGDDVELLDLTAAVDIDIGERVLTLSGGNMVISWGENLFIQNGINEVNPIRVPRLRTPGSELRDALIPLAAVDANFEVADNLSAEAFYLFEHDETIPEPEGTYFSDNDFASPGGEYVFLGFGRPPPMGPPDAPELVFGQGAGAPVGGVVRRGENRYPDDQGQFGLALRHTSERFNDAEFGLYWTRLHSRLPLVSARTATPAELMAGDFASGAEYYAEFPEDLDTLGVSFGTSLGDYSVAGELAYHIDRPLQVDEVELLYAALSPLDLASGDAVFQRGQLGQFNFGDTIKGWREKDVLQLGLNASTFLEGAFVDDVLKSDSLLVLAEVGATYIPDLESKSELRYGGPGTDTGGDPFFTLAGVQPETQKGGFADDFSAGYRLVARTEYLNAVKGVNLIPKLAFRHDAVGTSPGPGGNFVEDRMAVTVGVSAVYQQNLQGNVSYTNYFGGDEHNLLSDRDFVSISTSYSF